MRMMDVKIGRRRVDPNRSLDPSQCVVRLTGLEKQDAHHVHRIGVPGCRGENLLVNLTRFGQPSVGMQAFAVPEMIVDLALQVDHRLALTELANAGEARPERLLNLNKPQGSETVNLFISLS